MRIKGITLNDNKQIGYGLTAVFGLGRSRSLAILKKLNIDADRKVKDLTTEEETLVREEVDTYTLEGDLKRDISSDIKRLMDIRAYRGLRHGTTLPVRGQRTKTNNRTRRGNTRQTAGSGKLTVSKT